MSGIFGCVQHDPASALAAMDQAMAHWGPDRHAVWRDDQCGLGSRLLFNTPESLFEKLPRSVDNPRLAFTAEARLDNRPELLDALSIGHAEQATVADGDLILHAYLKWGEACADRLLGDWSFAIWNPDERRLFIARDHHGNTSLAYWQHGEHFAFASDPAALHAIGAPRRLNELYLAQVLTSWPAYNGSRSINLDVQRLPPAHAMVVTPHRIHTWRYWRLEDTPPLKMTSKQDYIEGFLEVYDRAVQDRLRSYRPVGTTLSGGLDSGSVTALAARALGKRGQRLTAFTSVPVHDTSMAVGPCRFGDESQFASLTAGQWENVDHQVLTSAQITPVQGIYRALAVMPEPSHAASNYFWIFDLLDQAKAQGLGTLLTGQGGNATVSWTGAPALRSGFDAFRYGGWKEGLRRSLSLRLRRRLARLRAQGQIWSGAAIDAEFAQRIHLAQQRVEAIGNDDTLREGWRSPRDMRYAIIQPGTSGIGHHWARQGAAAGLEVRDPTLDQRVLAYTIAVPDHLFAGPGAGDRWMIRESMAGLLPEAVRLNQKRGRQSADLAWRLLASASEVEAALSAVDAAPANTYVDVAKMRKAWTDVQTEVSALSTHRAGSILLRGLLAGIFLNSESAVT